MSAVGGLAGKDTICGLQDPRAQSGGSSGMTLLDVFFWGHGNNDVRKNMRLKSF